MQTEVFPLAMFAVGGMLLFPASNDLLLMFVALEVLSLPLYLLSGLARRRRLLSQEAAMKYFLLGAFSSAFFLYGVALLYGYAGSVDLGAIFTATGDRGQQRHPAATSASPCSPVGLLFKIGAVPFHSWTPDVYQGAPTPVTGFMAACTKVAAFGALLRVFYVAFGRSAWDWRPMMWGVAILTMVVGRRPRHHPDRRQADARLLLDRARRLHPHWRRRVSTERPVRLAVLPAGLRLHHDRRVRGRDPGPRRRRRGHPPVAVGRPGPAVPRWPASSPCSCWPSPASR